MTRQILRIAGRCGAALLLAAAGCSDDPGTGTTGHNGQSGNVFDPTTLRTSELTALQKVSDCKDLLTQIQDDAVAKLALAVARFRDSGYVAQNSGGVVRGGSPVFTDPSIAVDDAPSPSPTSAGAPASDNGTTLGANESSGSATVPTSPPSVSGTKDTSSDSDVATTASETNSQVEGVDEADFVKVVDNGKSMFLLHGNTLRRITTFPPQALADSGALLTLEGQPSEMFVTDNDIAVVFSSVYDTSTVIPYAASDVCTPYACGGNSYALAKVTVADVSGNTAKVLRELYYQGNYASSRRYGDVVRVVLGANAPYSDIFTPRVEVTDPFGTRYDDAQLEEQLVEWQARTEIAIRKTQLSNWLPLVKEKKGGQIVDVAPQCDTYFAPQVGLSDYGLTHVLSLDTTKPAADIGGVTVLGATTTVYSNAERLVLAQPDYRYDYGYVPEQRTVLHVFDLAGDKTSYSASGSVAGLLPQNNPQFGIDVGKNGVIRVGTCGLRRDTPDATPFSSAFLKTTTDIRVRTLAVKGDTLKVLGTSEAFGNPNDTLQSMRFVGDRAYGVTYLQQDPLVVLDVSDDGAPHVLGILHIPGFSQYLHPLDDTHLITFGQSGSGGSQLQLFDVSHPELAIPAPKVLDFGQGSYSEVAGNHKAFTYFAEQQLIALPVYGRYWDGTRQRRAYESGLQVVHVDAKSGFDLRGSVDHAKLYQQQGCGYCDSNGCYDFNCYSGEPEVRRGHFVATDNATYVYSFSYGGVIATDLATFENLASISLPQPQYGGGYYYPGDFGGKAVPPTGIALPVDGGTVAVSPTPQAGSATSASGG